MALIPDYWWPFGNNVTLTQESDSEFRRYGPYSAKLAGDAGTHPRLDPDTGAALSAFVRAAGMTSSPFPVHILESHRHMAQECSIKVASGQVALELWDVTGPVAGDPTRPLVIWPPRESGRRAVTSRTGVWIEDLFIETFEDFWKSASEKSTHFQLAFMVERDSTVAYVDWAQNVREGEAARIPYEGFASNDLLLAATHELQAVGDPRERIEVRAIDLTRLDDVTYPGELFTEGGDVFAAVKAVGDSTRRLLEVEDNPVTGEASKLALETNQDRVTRRLALAAARRRQMQRALDPPASIPGSVPDAVAQLTPEGLTVRVYPMPGHFETQVRLQGAGATPAARWRDGAVLGSQVGTTIVIPADALPVVRPLDLSVKSLGVTGRESETPFELTGVSEVTSSTLWRMPIDEALVLYWSLEEQEEPSMPPSCDPIDTGRVRDDSSPYGNHGYIYSWDFGNPGDTGPGASGYSLQYSDPGGAQYPSAQVVVDSDPTVSGPGNGPADQQDFDTNLDITVCAAIRPWLQDPDLCHHQGYDLWGRWAVGGTAGGHTFEEAGFYFGLTEFQDPTQGFKFMPAFRMQWFTNPSTPVVKGLLWPFDWSYGAWEGRRGVGSLDKVIMDRWIFVCQRIADDGAGGMNVDVFVGDLLTTTLTRLDPSTVGTGSDYASAYGLPLIIDNTLDTTRWTLGGRHLEANDRDTCQISNDGWFGHLDEHRRWNRVLSDEEVLGMFLHLSGQKPADEVWLVP